MRSAAWTRSHQGGTCNDGYVRSVGFRSLADGSSGSGTMKLIKNIPLEMVKRNTLALAKTAKILGIPVVLTSSQEQNVQGPLLPELEGILPEAFAARVKRAGIVNAWNDPNFKAAVERDATAQPDHGGRHHGCLSGLPVHQRLPGRVSSPSRPGCVRIAVRHFRRDVPAADGTRRRHRNGRRPIVELARVWRRDEGEPVLGSLLLREIYLK